MTIILNILSRYDHHPDHCLDRSCNHTGSQLLLPRWLLSHEIPVNRLYDAQVFSTRIFNWSKKTRTKKNWTEPRRRFRWWCAARSSDPSPPHPLPHHHRHLVGLLPARGLPLLSVFFKRVAPTINIVNIVKRLSLLSIWSFSWQPNHLQQPEVVEEPWISSEW